jgi:hypothetical protein
MIWTINFHILWKLSLSSHGKWTVCMVPISIKAKWFFFFLIFVWTWDILCFGQVFEGFLMEKKNQGLDFEIKMIVFHHLIRLRWGCCFSFCLVMYLSYLFNGAIELR